MTIEPSIEQIRNRADKREPKRLNARQKVVAATRTRATPTWIGICGIQDCPKEGGFHGTPMCESHAWEVWATLDALKGYEEDRKREYQEFLAYEEEQKRLERQQAAHRTATWKPQRWIEPGRIYYLHVGELVKIGFTKDLDQRLKQYPPHSELLATHPGTPKLEREMHHKFLHHLSHGREWFKPGDDLLDHINQVRQQFAQNAA